MKLGQVDCEVQWEVIKALYIYSLATATPPPIKSILFHPTTVRHFNGLEIHHRSHTEVDDADDDGDAIKSTATPARGHKEMELVYKSGNLLPKVSHSYPCYPPQQRLSSNDAGKTDRELILLSRLFAYAMLFTSVHNGGGGSSVLSGERKTATELKK